uniref:Mediator complex subunit 22 n=1 Tax=Angiostrongylus cantonensis TaxID=6313 RepID=A0A0K0CXH9_ANGCA
MFQAYERIVSKLHSENVLTDQLNSASNTAANIRSLFTSLCNKIEDRQKKMTEACLVDIVDFSNALDGIMAANVCDFNGDDEA